MYDSIIGTNISRIYRKLSKSNSKEVIAVKDVNLELLSSSINVVMGPSGSGKSTLLNIFGLLDGAYTGSIIINEVNMKKMKEYELAKYRNDNIGFVFQSFNLLPYLNAWENIYISMLLRPGNKKEKKEKAIFMLEQLGLIDRANHYPKQMSGGEQQRVAIARALCNDPFFIIADEPTANVDRDTEIIIMNLLVKLKNEGKILLIATHNPGFLEIANNIFNMRNGVLNDDKGE